MIKGLAHVCLSAEDLAAAEAFYAGTLGFRKLFEFTRTGKVVGFYFEISEGSYIEIFRQDGLDPDASCPIRHFCLEVSGMDALRGRLLSAGHAVSAKKLGRDGSWQCWITDPSGTRIEFHEYTPESAQHNPRTCILD